VQWYITVAYTNIATTKQATCMRNLGGLSSESMESGDINTLNQQLHVS